MIFTATITGDTREDIAKFLEEIVHTLRTTKETNCLSVNGDAEGEWDLGPLTVEYLSPPWSTTCV